MVYVYVCVSSFCDAFQLYIGEIDYDIGDKAYNGLKLWTIILDNIKNHKCSKLLRERKTVYVGGGSWLTNV